MLDYNLGFEFFVSFYSFFYKQTKLLQYLYFNSEKTDIQYELKDIIKHLKYNDLICTSLRTCIYEYNIT